MSVNIHGKEYVTVAERVKMLHGDNKKVSIKTELVSTNPIVMKATVEIEGKGSFTGHSYANVGKMIEKTNPYEVAETSAIGRAIGFAGYGIDEGIASADEMKNVDPTDSWVREPDEVPDDHVCPIHNVKMKERTRKDGTHWYDHRQEVNGEWQVCNGSGWNIKI